MIKTPTLRLPAWLRALALPALALSLGACSSASRGAGPGTSPSAGLVAPDSFTVEIKTSRGTVMLMIHRDWAPLGADRFYELVRSRYYDDTRFFRVVPNFVVQWGLAAKPEMTARWKPYPLQDDSVRHSNLRGTISFARAGRNTRTTQLFINLVDNARLDEDSGFGFPPFGEVISGMEAVDSIYSGYNSARPAISQDSITQRGNAYLMENYPYLDYINSVRVKKEFKH